MLGQHLRAGLVDDLGADDPRHAGVRLHPHRQVARRSQDLGHDDVRIREGAAAVQADGCDSERDDGSDGVGRAQPHHRPRSHVERERDDERQVGGALDPLDPPHGLLEREDRLQHEQVGAALGERGRLLGVGCDRTVAVEQPVRLDQLAGWSERARHEAVRAGAVPRQLRRAHVHFAGPARQRALLETQGRGAERTGEDDVGARVDEGPVQLDDAFGSLEQPLLGCQAGLHAHHLVVRPRRAVGDEDASLRQLAGERPGLRRARRGFHARPPYRRPPTAAARAGSNVVRHPTPGSTASRSGPRDVLRQRLDRHDLERPLVRGAEDDRGGDAGVERLEPA